MTLLNSGNLSTVAFCAIAVIGAPLELEPIGI